MTTRTATTRARLQDAALDLFERHGYRAVTVEQIAEAAGVSHMTFFRHFRSKERVLLDDPFDPVIADAVAAQPSELPAIERVARGLMTLVPLLDDALTDRSRRGIAIAAGVPELEAGMRANTAATESAIVAAAAPGSREMRIAAAACLAAITVSLMTWATATDARLSVIVTDALRTVVPSLEPRS
jgi:AcrR family transcriptional regulator